MSTPLDAAPGRILSHELIWQLQSDELVARELTPQTRASIRIVLGTLADFAP